jgi:hypothetical protein
MAYTVVPRLLHTTIRGIEFLRESPGPNPIHEGPVYRVDIVVNGKLESAEVLISRAGSCGLIRMPQVFGPLKYPVRVICDHARRFASGELFAFPIELGDIGKV